MILFLGITMDINELVGFRGMKPDIDHLEISFPVIEMVFNHVVVLDVIDAFAHLVLIRWRIFLDLK